MSSFESLKKNSASLAEKVRKSAEKSNYLNDNDDNQKYWKCEVDKAGNGYAIIRFLPPPAVDGDDASAFVTYYDHGFQGPGGWYIERSLTSIGQKDPVSELNSKLWQSGIDSNKEIARKQKRRLHYVSNIYVIKDSKNPENEGQIKLFRFGKKIFEKLCSAMNPQFEDDVKIDPFDFWSGANFKLKIRKVDGYQNYDLCEFDSQGPLFENDSEMEVLWKKEYSLNEVVSPNTFKSYEDLKNRLDRVLGSPSTDSNPPLTTVQQMKLEPKKQVSDESFDVEEVDELEYIKSMIEDD